MKLEDLKTAESIVHKLKVIESLILSLEHKKINSITVSVTYKNERRCETLLLPKHIVSALPVKSLDYLRIQKKQLEQKLESI